MNYEVHVGDYVKTIGGFVGWISNIKDNNYIVITDENNNSCGYHLPQEETYFVRISAYDFTNKEKKKIEQLNYNTSVDATLKQLSAFKNKINELVDAVNELRSDYDEHIEAHRQTDR